MLWQNKKKTQLSELKNLKQCMNIKTQKTNLIQMISNNMKMMIIF